MAQATWLVAASRPTMPPEEVDIPLVQVEPPSFVNRTSKLPLAPATASQPLLAVAKRIETIWSVTSVFQVRPPSAVRRRSVGQLRMGLAGGVELQASVSAQATWPSIAWIWTTAGPLTPSYGTASV